MNKACNDAYLIDKLTI